MSAFENPGGDIDKTKEGAPYVMRWEKAQHRTLEWHEVGI